MDPIKIIFFDIDGTLVDMNRKCISEKTVEALRRLRERGILLCIATGRSPVSLPKFEGVEFDAFLTFNGSYCFCKEGDIFSNPIPYADVMTLLRNAAGLGRPVALATKEKLTANGWEEDLAQYYAFAGLTLEPSEDFEECLREEVYQLMMGCREADYPAVLKDVQGAKITAWWDRAVDIIPAGGGKGVGIERILAHYGLDRSQAMAFGDGNNDIEMLQTVGTGVAMENASPRLKAVADDFCGHVAEDGIYHYCIQRGLI